MIKLPDELAYITNSLKPQKTTDARLDGKVCVISGTTSGVGYQAARQLAKAGAQLVMICRNREKALKVQSELARDFNAQADIIIADFQSLAEVARAGDEIAKTYPKVDVLINNAGVFNKQRQLTLDGHEMVFGVIHLASFLLTHKLLPNLKNGAPSRIIEINSEAHRFGGLNMKDLDWSKRPYIALQAYGAAKIAQLLTGLELSNRLNGSGVTLNIMHPGAVRTNIGMNNNFLYRFYSRYIIGWFLKDPLQSGKDIYYLAAAPELRSVTGKYFNQTNEEKPASYVMKAGLQQQVWEHSLQLIQPYLGGMHEI